jgi:hypothetical protein
MMKENEINMREEYYIQFKGRINKKKWSRIIKMFQEFHVTRSV